MYDIGFVERRRVVPQDVITPFVLSPNFELREDLSYELEENGSFELRNGD